MTTTDLVVVLPGIMGSTLNRHGTPLWAVTPGTLIEAVLRFGHRIDALRLPDGIGDDHPGDGVEPGKLMPTLHGIPRLWTPIKGYTELLDFLRRLGYHEATGDRPGNLLPVAYDWRLSNRFNGRRLSRIVGPALERWRAQGGQYAHAQVVFICHSMGGLVARWYIEHENGSSVTRKLITLGTPYRGAAKALAQLTDDSNGPLRRLGPDLTALIRTFPSVYQLLPEYACITRGPDLLKTTETSIPDLPTKMVADGMDFHTDLIGAERDRGQAVHDITHAIVGTRQTTDTTITVSAGRTTVQPTYGRDNLYGDGTVPLTGAVRSGLALDSPLIRRIADKHGNLQRNQAVFDEIEGALTGQEIVVRDLARVQPRVEVPELLSAGRPLDVTVDLGENHAVLLTLRDETGAEVDTRMPRPSKGVARAQFTDIPPGGYSLDVTGPTAASPLAPVSSDLIVWPLDAITATH